MFVNNTTREDVCMNKAALRVPKVTGEYGRGCARDLGNTASS